MAEYQVNLGMDGESKKGTLSEMLEPLPYAQDAFLACPFMLYVTINCAFSCMFWSRICQNSISQGDAMGLMQSV